MKMNIFLAIAVAISMTATTSCNQSQANDESKTVEVTTEANAPEEIESLATELMSEGTEVDKDNDDALYYIPKQILKR